MKKRKTTDSKKYVVTIDAKLHRKLLAHKRKTKMPISTTVTAAVKEYL